MDIAWDGMTYRAEITAQTDGTLKLADGREFAHGAGETITVEGRITR